MHDIVTKEGFAYSFVPSACESCGGHCCTGESGCIYVNKSEMQRIASFLHVDIEELKEKYLFKKGYKFSIRERKVNESFECIFFDAETKGCSIYEARPIQCRTFPFWDYYKTRVDELKQECPGVLG
jgi:Fe-S-cluster containining protein